MQPAAEYAAATLAAFGGDKRAAVAALCEALRDRAYPGMGAGYVADVIAAIYA